MELVDEATRRLGTAHRLLADHDLVEDGAWPRACVWLIRLALERALDDFWATHAPAVGTASRRAQLLTLTRAVDEDLGHRATALWNTLSRAAHHHAYELAPTAAELRSWHREVSDVAAALRAHA